jgi:MFS family permease
MELYAVRVWLPGLLAATLVAGGESTTEATVKAATVGGIALAAGSVGPIIGGVISDRFGRAQTAAAIFALSGACSWVIGWMVGFPWPLVVGIAVVYGWAISADSSIYSTAVTESAKAEDLGSTMALQAFLGFMGGVVGPILVGGVLDIFPENLEWKMGFSAVGMMAVVSIPVLLRAGNLRRTPEA